MNLYCNKGISMCISYSYLWQNHSQISWHWHLFLLPNLHEIIQVLTNTASIWMLSYKTTVLHITWCCLKFKSNIWGGSMKQSVDEKNTHLTGTDTFASQMKHSSCYWLQIIFHWIRRLTCVAAVCSLVLICIRLCVSIMYQCQKKAKYIKTQQISWKRHCWYSKTTADLLYRQRMCRKNAETLGQTASAESGGSSPFFFKQQSNEQVGVEAFRAATL